MRTRSQTQQPSRTPAASSGLQRLRDPRGSQGKMEEEAQGWGQGTGPRRRSEATKPGRLTKSECKQTSLWEAAGSNSEWKATGAYPQKPAKQGPRRRGIQLC